ncbi:MAG: outer membrane protein assembly factor, partial [Bacteroidales bacterium]|nr:outer membrane protein assembly factor [Bacteroidales bacterium]
MSKNNNIAHKLYTTKIIQLSFLVVLMIIFTSCSGTRRLSDEQYLLHKNKVQIDNKDIDKRIFKQYNRQKPNKKILGIFKVHLFMYNLANPQKDNSLHNWLRRIGETPVVYDKGLQNLTRERYQLYLESKGYYHAQIKDTTSFNNKKAIAVYSVKTGKPYSIKNISYVIEDTTIQKIIFNDTINSLIKKGIAFDKNILQEERERIEYLMKTQGYFKFKKE